MPRVYKTRYCCYCRTDLWVSKTTFLCDECGALKVNPPRTQKDLKNFVMKPIWDNHSGHKLPMKFTFE